MSDVGFRVDFGRARNLTTAAESPEIRNPTPRWLRSPFCCSESWATGRCQWLRSPASITRHSGQCRASRRESRNYGVRGGDSARARILHHRRRRVDELDQLAGPHLDYRSVRARPQYRRRRPGRASRHLQSRGGPAGGHAAAALVSEGKPGRAARALSLAHFRHAAALHRG
jgi:hypothetical protein